MQPTGELLRNILTEAKPKLLAISEAKSEEKPASGKWSAKELIGHLVDSASNNHQRFVRASFKNDLMFEGYDQEGWVELQAYQSANWEELVELWFQFNLHLSKVMDAIPEEVKSKERALHNLDKIAWKTIPKSEPATLAYFMADYVGHLQHHLNQVFSL